MIVTLVHIWVKDQFVDDFIRATIDNHENTVKESGNIRFDFLSDASDKTKFVLYEVFESEEAVAAHKTTAHYLRWRDAVADWMAQPRQGLRHNVICPTDSFIMVETFGLLRTPKIYCGTGEISRLPAILKNRCKRALVLTGSKSYAHNKAIAELISRPGKGKNHPRF